jgi:hypothetical protein
MDTLKRDDRSKKIKRWIYRLELVMLVIIRVLTLAILAYVTWEIFYIREIIEYLRKAW